MMNQNASHDFSSEIERWEAVLRHDIKADGTFFFGVTSTRIYCRPSCKSRIPRRENIMFFDTASEAEAAGFRACKRCQPNLDSCLSGHQAAILQACKYLDTAEHQPLLCDLAKSAGLSPFHFQRLFKRLVGISPKQYYQEKRLNRVRMNLSKSNNVTDVIYDSGFGSSGHFYGESNAVLGMTPSKYRNGGQGVEINFLIEQSYLGWVLVAATQKGIVVIDIGDSPAELENALKVRFPHAHLSAGDTHFSTWVSQVLKFMEAPAAGIHLPLDIQGTVFQRRVWEALTRIPAGSTLTYADIARQMGNPKAVRAVAQACASNNIAVAIPCHRVVCSNGDLGGYRWGLTRKRALLNREKETI